jgi:hypothetical protein
MIMTNALHLAAVSAVLLALTFGCRSKEEQARREREWEQRQWAKQQDRREDAFPMFDERPDVGRMMNAQAVVGARKDATLYDAHFDGTQLNSLGREKLSRMLHREPADRPQPIYVDLPDADTLSGERRKSLERYLEDAGIDLASVEIRPGPNTDTTHPAAPSIARLRKTETMLGDGSGPGAVGPNAGTTTTGGMGGTATGYSSGGTGGTGAAR